jgi:hypothetical protein
MPLDKAMQIRVERLPRYAQQLIERLQRDLDHANERLAEGPEGSDTFADPYATPPRPLGTGTMIQFGAGDETFKVHYEDGQLCIALQTMGPRDLAVLPWSANSVRLEPLYRNRRPQ